MIATLVYWALAIEAQASVPPLDVALLPGEIAAGWQYERYELHRAELVQRMYLHGWQDGCWQTWIDQCDAALAYWRLVIAYHRSATGSQGERAVLWALADLDGPWWGTHAPPELPEPVRIMPSAPPDPNAAGG